MKYRIFNSTRMWQILALVFASLTSAKILFSPQSFQYADGNSSQTTVNVKLDHQPTSDVIIELKQNANLLFTPCQLKFTPSNWNQTQAVSVTGAFAWNTSYAANKMTTNLVAQTLWTNDKTFNATSASFQVTRLIEGSVKCRSHGDPHYVTFNNVKFDWMVCRSFFLCQ